MNLSFGFLWTMIAIARPENAAKAGRVASRLYRWADIAAQMPSPLRPAQPTRSAVLRALELGLGESCWPCDPDAVTEAIPVAAFRGASGR